MHLKLIRKFSNYVTRIGIDLGHRQIFLKDRVQVKLTHNKEKYFKLKKMDNILN